MPGESVDLSVPRVVKDPVVVHDSRIHINAPAKLVFSILIGINDYPTWNPLFKAITGAKDGVLKIGLPITLWFVRNSQHVF
ncbi:hypothetical protein BJ742DRAFT_781443 [Cladochytrium replicatum]|nr:hypothetical protein BJ742DRAFT_781443 [Cladochytrium replicatum]